MRLFSPMVVLCTLFVSGITQAEEFIVKFKGEPSFFGMSIPAGVEIMETHAPGQLVKVDIERSRKFTAIRALLDNDAIEYVVPNIKMYAFGEPNDKDFKKQWALAKTNAAKAWDTTTGHRDVVVAVIDTGIDYKHPDLAANIWVNKKEIAGNGIDDDGNGYKDDVHGWDFAGKDNDPDDETSSKNPGHGTHCAGIVGAVGNNKIGVSGMSQEVSLMPVRFLTKNGSGNLFDGAKSIDYATNNGAHIISASWGAAAPESGAKPIIEAIARANAKGVIFVAAAGNNGKNSDSFSIYPANTQLPNMITVAASAENDSKPSWSNFGKANVHLASPGDAILSTIPGSKYMNLRGTSMATPLVSGLAALLLSATKEKIDGLTMRSILQNTGAKVKIETACNCRIDAAAAMDTVVNKKLTVVPNAVTIAPQGSQQFSAFGGKGPYKFKSGDNKVATIDASGKLSAVALGETTITVTDANGKTAQSLAVRIAKKSKGGGMQCPLPNPQFCQLFCIINPNLPWCQ